MARSEFIRAKSDAPSSTAEPILPVNTDKPGNSAPGKSAIVISLAGLAVVALIAAILLLYHSAPETRGTQYATADTVVHAAADSASPSEGILTRGAAVSGGWLTASDGSRWLKIKWLDHEVGFVAPSALSPAPRPNLLFDPTLTNTAQTAMTVRHEPADDAATDESLPAGSMIHVIGVTGDGWAEISRNGGVGYVRVSALRPPSVPVDLPPATTTTAQQVSPDQAATTTPDAVAANEPAPQATTGVSTYACVFTPEASQNPIIGAHSLSFRLDEDRSCVNDRSAYLKLGNGTLRRHMLIDKDNRLSMLLISGDRKRFARLDYYLTRQAYSEIRQTFPVLISIACPALGDDAARSAVQQSLAAASPMIGTDSPAVTSWRKTVWSCAPVQ